MTRRTGRLVAAALICMAFVSCATDEGPREDPMTPTLRRAIYGKMVGTVNPALNAIRRAAAEGEFGPVPEAASKLQRASADIAGDVRRHPQIVAQEKEWIVEVYRQLGTQASAMSEAAEEGDLDELLRLIDATRGETCNGCHNRYGYRPVS